MGVLPGPVRAIPGAGGPWNGRPGEATPSQLLGKEISRAVFSRYGQTCWLALTKDELLAAAKELCGNSINCAVNRLNLSEMKQGAEEPFWLFRACVEAVACTCKFQQQCSSDNCTTDNDFT